MTKAERGYLACVAAVAFVVMAAIVYGAIAQTGINTLPPGFPYATGPKPTPSGTCTAGTQTGGTFAGTIVLTCTAQTLTLTFPFPAPNGWACDAHDETTPADLLNQNGHSTTTASFASTTTAASDVVSFKCAAY
jgi:hypothetical protein